MIPYFQQQLSSGAESMFYSWGMVWLTFILTICFLCLISVALIPYAIDLYIWIVKAIERHRR